MFLVRAKTLLNKTEMNCCVDFQNLSTLLNILESSSLVEKFQVYSTTIGPMKQEAFPCGGFNKWTTENLY